MQDEYAIEMRMEAAEAERMEIDWRCGSGNAPPPGGPGCN